MNTERIGGMVGLRYKLLWAKTRSRNGRIALFFAGYLLFVMVLALMVSGGVGAGIIAARNGKAELVARIVLGSVFLQALIASVSLGFGMNNIFSDLELRRYPLRAHERFLVRHIIGIADPFWAFFLLLELGLVAGLYIYGSTPFGLGVLAVLLLFLANYLLARIIGAGVDRLTKRRSGSVILMAIFITLSLLPSAAGPMFKKHPEWVPKLLDVLAYTPPFGASAAVAHTGAAAAWGLLLVLGWIIGELLLLIAMETRPPVVQREETLTVSWETPYEKVAALFPASEAPFVAHWLRFYVRNNRFRAMYFLALPLVAFLTFNMSRSRTGDDALFLAALGTFPMVTFMGTARFAVNQYGYTGGGFRRYLLLPGDPGASLRAGAFASLLLGAVLIPVALVGWIALAPVAFDARIIVMLASSAITGLFVFNGLGLWVSMLNPKKGNYSSSFGNDLSLGGNIVLIGGIMVSIVLPMVLRKVAPAVVSPRNWWTGAGAALAAVAFFIFSLRAAQELFRQRRERLLAVVEGRD